eukprot:CAMPEP_0172456336 /NCGR_PEP_ID=MMETSP1065-20121228/15205_1 /TAXON_ID=265537 /ORGANISM="Amphiprora paludosa, Strain CCMP125" /LENGTH=51 /DNA_ID=CAMNT_0013209239 /DNA_START=300 /DNA_END=451 /DNA_ORIENTATION=-
MSGCHGLHTQMAQITAASLLPSTPSAAPRRTPPPNSGAIFVSDLSNAIITT